ncbi:MAG: hypothetical protein Q9191_002968 [Dirinaria sp. TL-2023a]
MDHSQTKPAIAEATTTSMHAGSPPDNNLTDPSAPITKPSCSNPSCPAPGTKLCASCRKISYCSRECQKVDWPDHKAHCTVQAVRLNATDHRRSDYQQVTLKHNDPIFQTKPIPISRTLGFQLLVAKLEDIPPRGGSNPHAVRLMIDPHTLWAPDDWQMILRTWDVIVARADKKPLETSTLAIMLDYIHEIMENCDQPEAATNWEPKPESYYDVKRFKEYMASHAKGRSQGSRD